MLLSYRDCEIKFGNDYQIKKALASGELFKIEPGIYADTANVSEIEVISFKYPRAVFTMNSAFYYHSLTDVIPEKYFLATAKDAHKIGGKRIKQIFHREGQFPIGITTMEYRNFAIRIYDKERMLIELIRNKRALPFDYYKEVVEGYRRIVQTLDLEKMQEYILAFPNQRHIMEAVELEVL